MYPQKYKVALAVLLFTMLLSLIYFLFIGFSLFESNPAYLFNVIPYLVMLFACAIILSPILLKANGHWIYFFIGSGVISALSMVTRRYSYLFWLIVLLGITVTIYIFYKKRVDILKNKSNAMEKIKEAVNIVKFNHQQVGEFNSALSQRLDRYRSLREIGESFSARLSLEDICQLAVDTAYEMIPETDAAMLFLVDKNQQKLMLFMSKKASALPKIKSKTGDIFDKWVFKERQSLSVEDINEDFRFDYTPLSGERYFKSLISVPMISQSRITGLLRLNSREKNSYSFDDLRLLDFISDLTSSAINNARLYKTTEELSTKDSLTGFYINR